jgi:ABC-2 type transport system ATP-binding protein
VSEVAVEVDGVSKRFRLYHDRNQSLKAAAMRGRRARFEEFWALDDVSMTVPAGRTFGLIGENGSGKSTLLKCMARILRPDKGRVSTYGKVSALLELGAGFHPELSGRDNVFLNGAILGMSRREIQDRFDDIVAFAGLERFIDTPVKNYSSGMYVRLGFSVAINVEPEILLVDEVLAVGDEQFQRRCAEKFAELRHDGKTIVLVSHALGTMQHMCDEVAWMDHGVCRELGPAPQVVDQYLSSLQADPVATDDGSSGSRHGTGEIRVVGVEMLDAKGQPVVAARTGDEVTFRMRYETTRPVKRPVFGVGIYTLEGILATGPNLKDVNRVPDELSGTGTVELTIPRIMLLPGNYDLSAGVTDDAILHVYDWRRKSFRFTVLPGTPHEAAGGLFSMAGTWTVDPVSDGAPAVEATP